MTALLRYLVIKQSREGALAALLVGPALLILAPAVAYAIAEIVRGRFSWPMETKVEAGFEVIPMLLLMVCGVAACTAAFAAFGREAMAHALGPIVLASSPQTVVLASALFATACAFVAFGLAVVAAAFIHVSFDVVSSPEALSAAMIAARALVVCACGAAAGAAMVSISPVTTMMVPAIAITLTTAVWESENFTPAKGAVAIVATAFLLVVATWFTRRRCAA